MEQLAQFVTKSFEYNNCFSIKLLEAKQSAGGNDEKEATATGEAFLSFGLRASSLHSSSSSASNSSSNGTMNNHLMMDIEEDPQDVKTIKEDGSDCEVKENKNEIAKQKCGEDEKQEDGQVDEDEDEIDIETDSLCELEDNKRLIVKTPVDGQGNKPTDLRMHGLSSRMQEKVCRDKVETMDVNNNCSSNKSVIKPPITKNWLIPDYKGKRND